MLKSLGWLTLESRRYISRLTQLYKIIHHYTPAIHQPAYYLTTQYPTRHLHQYHFILPSISTTAYQQSFFLKTIKQQNNLLNGVIEFSSVEHFVSAIRPLQVNSFHCPQKCMQAGGSLFIIHYLKITIKLSCDRHTYLAITQ